MALDEQGTAFIRSEYDRADRHLHTARILNYLLQTSTNDEGLRDIAQRCNRLSPKKIETPTSTLTDRKDQLITSIARHLNGRDIDKEKVGDPHMIVEHFNHWITEFPISGAVEEDVIDALASRWSANARRLKSLKRGVHGDEGLRRVAMALVCMVLRTKPLVRHGIDADNFFAALKKRAHRARTG